METVPWTLFPNHASATKKEFEQTWPDLIAHINAAGPYAAKAACPWIKLARFGDLRTDKMALRHDSNLLEVTGVEGDYDAEVIQPEEAIIRLERSGIRAIVYTSPSHQPAKPRWRVLAPLMRPAKPADRSHLLARVNGALGGVLTRESFTLSQSYYFGRVEGHDYRVLVTWDDPMEGCCVDELGNLDAIACTAKTAARLNNHQPGATHTHAIAAAVERLGRRLRTGDGRRDLLKEYIGEKSARGLKLDELMALLNDVVDRFFDPADPPDWANIKRICADFVSADSAKRSARLSDPRPGPVSDSQNLILSEKDAIRPCDHNAFVLLGAAPRYESLLFDEFLSRMRFEDRDWIDADDLAAARWLQSEHGVAQFNLGHARNAARSLAYARRTDSLVEFVERLPAWDGTLRIEQAFADAWGAPDTELIRAASSNFFVALIARARHPGSQVDTLWAFEGPQGTFKSRALRALGGAFHAEISAPIGTTDFQRELRGLWLAELSELDSLKGKESTTIKRLLSAPADRFVQKYALHAESYPRRAVAVATTNEATYWQDSTGARRLIPIPCGDIRCDSILANRLQWFAEAAHAHAAGAKWWEFPGSIADAQEQRQQIDPWEDTLQEFMDHGRKIGSGTFDPWPEGKIASAVILREWLQIDPSHQSTQFSTRLGKVMNRLGFVPTRIGKSKSRGWIKG